MKKTKKDPFPPFLTEAVKGPFPPWLGKLAARVIRVYLPTLTIREAEDLLKNGVESLVLSGFAGVPPETTARVAGHLYAVVLSEQSSITDTHREIFGLLAQDFIAPFLSLSLPDAQKTLAAFSKAFDHTATELGQEGSSTVYFSVDLMMLCFWKQVSQLESVSALHQYLQQVVVKHPAGGLKRLEKLCSEIGLRYRARGRPTRKILPKRKNE